MKQALAAAASVAKPTPSGSHHNSAALGPKISEHNKPWVRLDVDCFNRSYRTATRFQCSFIRNIYHPFVCMCAHIKQGNVSSACSLRIFVVFCVLKMNNGMLEAAVRFWIFAPLLFCLADGSWILVAIKCVLNVDWYLVFELLCIQTRRHYCFDDVSG